MKTLDRINQPAIKIPDKISLLKPEEIKLDNGILVNSINAGTQDVVKIECIFRAGVWYQDKKLLAFSTIKMLTEGTKKHSASRLAEIFDSHGAFIETEAEKDNTYISLYCLNKHLEKLLPVLAEMINEPTFPQNELSVFLENTKQEQLVSMQRVSFLARLKFTEQLFGAKHPYGQSAAIEDYDNVERNEIISYHKKNYHAGNMRMIVSGKVNKNTLKLVNTYFGNSVRLKPGKTEKERVLETSGSKNKKAFFPQKDAIQSGIRIGKMLFTKKDPDYFGMLVLNMILGGYFGSRLIKNIREDKGYTYGIGSGIMSMRNAGYFYIASEVGADVRKQAVREVYKEIERLRKEPVLPEELNLVKNYMIGSFLRSIDGPFALADKLKGIIDYDLDFTKYYSQYIQTIKKITSKQLLELANRHLREDSIYETVVGK
jgi:predicted Zn-dependent peptidase